MNSISNLNGVDRGNKIMKTITYEAYNYARLKAKRDEKFTQSGLL